MQCAAAVILTSILILIGFQVRFNVVSAAEVEKWVIHDMLLHWHEERPCDMNEKWLGGDEQGSSSFVFDEAISTDGQVAVRSDDSPGQKRGLFNTARSNCSCGRGVPLERCICVQVEYCATESSKQASNGVDGTADGTAQGSRIRLTLSSHLVSQDATM